MTFNPQVSSVQEAPTRLSRSVLWQLQEKLYRTKGIEIWREKPAFISSSTYHSDLCAELVLSLLLDLNATLDHAQPVYLIELGAGSGCFAYRFLKSLQKQMAFYRQFRDLRIKYVLTDIVPELSQFWQNNGRLRRFIEDGALDWAVFAPDRDPHIALANAGTFNNNDFVNAPLFIANSVFDTIHQDAFRIQGGKLYERQVQISLHDDDETLSAVQLTEGDALISFDRYYDDPALTAILGEYVKLLQDGLLIMPTGAVDILNNLRRLSNSRFALLNFSRGYTDPGFLEGKSELEYTDLSFKLNFHALERYYQLLGGSCFSTPCIKRAHCLSLGVFGVPALEHTGHFFSHTLQQQDRALVLPLLEKRLCAGLDFIPDPDGTNQLEEFVGVLKLFHYDPNVFVSYLNMHFDVLERSILHATEQELSMLLVAVAAVEQNIYAFGEPLQESDFRQGPYAALIHVWRKAQSACRVTSGLRDGALR